MATVVLLEGDPLEREQLIRALKHADYEVAEAADGLELIRHVFSLRPDAVVMNLQVPHFDGFEAIRVLRAATDIPLVVLGRSHSTSMAVRSLDMGADDYIELPVEPEEIAARVRALLRRAQRRLDGEAETTVVRTGSICVDRGSHTVTKAGAVIPLTRTEYRLLDALASRAGKVAPHRYLLSTVWGEEYIDDTHYLRVYIGYLRAKLEDSPAQPQYLLNEWGTGYRLAMLPQNVGGTEHVEPVNDSEPMLATG